MTEYPEDSPTELWIVRHGETEWSATGRHTSTTDVELTEAGEAAARVIGERLRGTTFDLVLTSPRERARRTAALAGTATGFSTMVANSAGPVASLYLLMMRTSKLAFVGTAAWLFFLLNLAKLPFSAGLGLITAESLRLDVVLLPTVLAGALVGVRVLRHVPQRAFERTTLVLTVVSSLVLLLA